MKDTSTGYRVSFSYISTPVDKPSIESKKKIHNNPLISLELGGKKDNIPQIKIPERGYQTHRPMHSDEHTLKKEIWEVEATTKRKQTDKTIIKSMQTQGKVLNLEELSPQKNVSSNEINVLKDEIRYLRKRLIQVENSQKTIKLQFQLSKSKKQSRTDSTNQKRQQGVSINKNQDEEKTRLRGELLQSQRKRSELELKIQQQNTHKSQVITSNRQLTQMLQTKQTEFQDMKQKMEQIKNTIQLSQAQRASFIEKQQQNQQIFTLQLEKISQQNQRLNNLFQSQKNVKLFLQHELKQKILQNNSLKVTVDQLTFQIQNRLKDIQFLNQQSFSLDMSLSNTLQELKFLKLQSNQSFKSKQGEGRIKAAQDYIKSLQIRILQLQGQVQKAGITIYSLQDQYNGILRRLNQQLFIVEQFKQKNQWLQNQKLQIKRQKISQDQNNLQSLCHIQEQLFSLKVQNQQLKNQKTRLEESQRVLVNEIQWIINQKNGAIIKIENKHKQEVDSLLLKIQEIKKKKDEQQTIFISQLTKKQQQLKKQNETKINISSFHSFVSSIKQLQPDNSSDSSLSPNDIQKHLLRLKKQASINEEQNTKLREMLQTTQGQLSLSQRNQNDQIRLLRQKYERQIQLSKEQYTMHLNTYIQEIQRLMAEMDKFKSKSKYCASEVIQEDPEEDYSMELAKEEKVKKDLIIYGQDPFDYYVSPPSDTPAKNPDQKGENNYLLKDIIDLDQKINCYISNLKTKKNKIEQ